MKTLKITLIAVLAICFSSCNSNSTAEDTVDKLVEAYAKIPKIIDGVTDVESAKKANEEIATIVDKIIAINKELITMKVTASKKEELDKLLADENKKYEANIQASLSKLTTNHPKAAMEITKGLMKASAKKMDEASK